MQEEIEAKHSEPTQERNRDETLERVRCGLRTGDRLHVSASSCWPTATTAHGLSERALGDDGHFAAPFRRINAHGLPALLAPFVQCGFDVFVLRPKHTADGLHPILPIGQFGHIASSRTAAQPAAADER